MIFPLNFLWQTNDRVAVHIETSHLFASVLALTKWNQVRELNQKLEFVLVNG